MCTKLRNNCPCNRQSSLRFTGSCLRAGGTAGEPPVGCRGHRVCWQLPFLSFLPPRAAMHSMELAALAEGEGGIGQPALCCANLLQGKKRVWVPLHIPRSSQLHGVSAPHGDASPSNVGFRRISIPVWPPGSIPAGQGHLSKLHGDQYQPNPHVQSSLGWWNSSLSHVGIRTVPVPCGGALVRQQQPPLLFGLTRSKLLTVSAHIDTISQ